MRKSVNNMFVLGGGVVFECFPIFGWMVTCGKAAPIQLSKLSRGMIDACFLAVPETEVDLHATLKGMVNSVWDEPLENLAGLTKGVLGTVGDYTVKYTDNPTVAEDGLHLNKGVRDTVEETPIGSDEQIDRYKAACLHAPDFTTPPAKDFEQTLNDQLRVVISVAEQVLTGNLDLGFNVLIPGLDPNMFHVRRADLSAPVSVIIYGVSSVSCRGASDAILFILEQAGVKRAIMNKQAYDEAVDNRVPTTWDEAFGHLSPTNIPGMFKVNYDKKPYYNQQFNPTMCQPGMMMPAMMQPGMIPPLNHGGMFKPNTHFQPHTPHIVLDTSTLVGTAMDKETQLGLFLAHVGPNRGVHLHNRNKTVTVSVELPTGRHQVKDGEVVIFSSQTLTEVVKFLLSNNTPLRSF